MVILSILVSLSFAAPYTNTKDITVSTFNLHGFSASSAYLKGCLNSHGGLWMVQEHLLSEQQLHLFQKLDGQFVARSGMEDAFSSGIYRGRLNY